MSFLDQTRDLLQRPDRLHGLIFDSAFFLGNLVVVFGLADLYQTLPDQIIGGLMGLAIGSLIGGALWKNRFLKQRLSPPPKGEGGLANTLLNILAFWLFILITLTAVMMFALVGLYTPSDSATLTGADYLFVLTGLGIGALVTALVYRAGQPHKFGPQEDFHKDWREFGADALLWLAAWLLTRFYWGSLVDMIDPTIEFGFSGRGLTLIIAMTLLYIVFYLPGRYLFLVEDARSPGTWLQVWLPIVPVYLMILFR